jgi:hypothetical protein
VNFFFGNLGIFLSENSKKLLKIWKRNCKNFKTIKLKKRKKKKKKRRRPDYNI